MEKQGGGVTFTSNTLSKLSHISVLIFPFKLYLLPLKLNASSTSLRSQGPANLPRSVFSAKFLRYIYCRNIIHCRKHTKLFSDHLSYYDEIYKTFNGKCTIWSLWYNTSIHRELETYPFKNSLSHLKTRIGFLQPTKRLKKHLQISWAIQNVPRAFTWKKFKLHKTRKKKWKIKLLVVSNLTAERLSLHLVGEVPILQLCRYSAEGSWVCITKHVRSPENCTTLRENWQNKTKKKIKIPP
jgi:hypothetical protein